MDTRSVSYLTSDYEFAIGADIKRKNIITMKLFLVAYILWPHFDLLASKDFLGSVLCVHDDTDSGSHESDFSLIGVFQVICAVGIAIAINMLNFVLNIWLRFVDLCKNIDVNRIDYLLTSSGFALFSVSACKKGAALKFDVLSQFKQFKLDTSLRWL
jgi:hypothetical protein